MGPRKNFGAVPGEERLVGSHDMLAGVDRLQHELARIGDAADQLDHDVDAGARDDLGGAGDHLDAVERHGALLGEVARARHRDDDVAARAARNLAAVAPQHLDRSAPDGSEAEEANRDGFHSFLLKWNAVIGICSRK